MLYPSDERCTRERHISTDKEDVGVALSDKNKLSPMVRVIFP